MTAFLFETEDCEAATVCAKIDGQVAALRENRKIFLLSPGQGNLV